MISNVVLVTSPEMTPISMSILSFFVCYTLYDVTKGHLADRLEMQPEQGVLFLLPFKHVEDATKHHLIQSYQSFKLDDFIFQLVGALFSCPDGPPPHPHPFQDTSYLLFYASTL